ncbi:uncharacterized protein LOC132636365 isoform X2 [Lycium barbarum]|uniref:uncharacterized protein LOC132636365 isoform X2 n=1 Tax=Lycium barbarum TaxID=112863 RepID=UPI00293EF3E2|nr:uncharacterized protein LOC132636365 isoform X2 [Lycium barbarum]
MTQRKSSRLKNKATRITSLANQKKFLLARRTTAPASSIRSLQLLTNAIEEHQLLAPQHPEVGAHIQTESTTPATQSVEEHPEVGAHIQTESTTPATQSVEEQVQLDSTTLAGNEQCDEQGSSTQKRKRGKTKMLNVHGRHEHKLIVLNEHGEPVGPSEDDVTELSSFLGTLARNTTLCPLDIYDWRKVNTKKDLWNYTKEKYDIPDIAKKWTLGRIQNAWRRRKRDLKKIHFEPYANDEIRMEKRPDDVPASQFKELLKYWNSEKAQKMSKINVENRKKLKNPHTVGKKSFAIVRNELAKEMETSDPLSLEEIFVATRKRKPGRSYKDSDEDTTSKIAEMVNIETQQNEDGNESINAFVSVTVPEHSGHLRLYGRGVTKTTLKGKVGHFEPSSNAINDLKKMEERMIRLEEKLQEQKEQFEEQKTLMRQEIVEDVITKLQRSGLPFDASVLATLGEASSTRAAAIQPINHPSIGSNNQVGERNLYLS